MTLDQLKYFSETAKLQHLGRAANALSISPSAVSHAITQLEEELGQSLFKKVGRNILLTPSGEKLLEYAEDILNRVDGIKLKFGDKTVGEKKHFRIASSHLLASQLLLPAWNTLQSRYPDVTCEFFTYRSVQVIEEVVGGYLDLGVCFSPQASTQIKSLDVLRGQMYVYVRKGHPVLKKKKPLEEISQYPAVLPKAFSGIDVCIQHPMFDEFGIQPQIEVAYDNYWVAAERLKSSDCWSLLPDWVPSVFSGDIVKVKTPTSWEAEYWISAIHRAKMSPSPLLLELVGAIQEVVQSR